MNRIDPLHCKRLIHFLQKENTPLQNKYICPRCMCRKLIIESSNCIYLTKENEIVTKLNDIFNDVNDGKHNLLTEQDHAKSNCVLCLGILQDKFLLPFAEKVSKVLEASGFDYSDAIGENMQTNTSLPSALYIREYKFWQLFYKDVNLNDPSSAIQAQSFKSYSSERDKMFVGIRFILRKFIIEKLMILNRNANNSNNNNNNNNVEYWKQKFNDNFVIRHQHVDMDIDMLSSLNTNDSIHEEMLKQSNEDRAIKPLNDLSIRITINYKSNFYEVEEFCKKICSVLGTKIIYDTCNNNDNSDKHESGSDNHKKNSRKYKRQRISKNNKGKRIIATGEVIRLIDNFVKNKFLKKGNGKNNDDSSSSSVTTTTTTTTTIVSGASKFIDKMIFPNVNFPMELSASNNNNNSNMIVEKPAKKQDEMVKIHIERETIYLKGNYIKHLRGLPQSPWSINGVRKGISSVQEYLAENIIKLYEPKSYKFHSSGREDIDVRMLGNGRPYALELINCKMCPIKMSKYLSVIENLTNETYDAIESNGLTWCTESDPYVSLEANCEDKNKTYACVCCVSKPVSAKELVEKLDSICVKPIPIIQKTPIRVLHRRPNLDRTRHIYSMKTEWLNKHFFILTLIAEAGTYIKEFVHSDFGRTRPNVGELLGKDVDADILQLDVMSVNFNNKKE